MENPNSNMLSASHIASRAAFHMIPISGKSSKLLLIVGITTTGPHWVLQCGHVHGSNGWHRSCATRHSYEQQLGFSHLLHAMEPCGFINAPSQAGRSML